MISLDDLKPRIVDVNIIIGKLPPEKEDELPIDDVLTIPLRVPAWVEWNELGLEIETPVAEMVESFKSGKKTYEKESGVPYQEKVTLANNRRMVRRLTFALIEGGNFPSLRDSTVDEQMAAIAGMDAGIVQALARTLNNLVSFTAGQVSDTAARFRSVAVPENGHAGVQPPGLDSPEMEETTRD